MGLWGRIYVLIKLSQGWRPLERHFCARKSARTREKAPIANEYLWLEQQSHLVKRKSMPIVKTKGVSRLLVLIWILIMKVCVSKSCWKHLGTGCRLLRNCLLYMLACRNFPLYACSRLVKRAYGPQDKAQQAANDLTCKRKSFAACRKAADV